MAVDQTEQGEVAGAITAVNGACYIIAPVFGVMLYEFKGPLPYLFNVLVLIALLGFAFRNPTLKAVGEDLVETDPTLTES